MLTGRRVAFQRKCVPSRKLETIVRRCLEEDPALRWQSAAQLERELAGVSAGGSRGNRYATAVASVPADYSDSHRTPKLADKSTIVLADFANATGDPDFDSVLRHILAVQLGNSARLSLLPDARVSQTLGLMGRSANTKLTPDVAAEICERTTSAAVVQGSITSMGNKYMLSLRATNCRTGEVLGQEQARAAKKEDLFKALGQMANRFGSRTGELLPHVVKEPSLPAEVTTPSLDAWRSYSSAMREFQARAQSPEGISLLRRAIEFDPNFAMAYASLGRDIADLGETELAAKNVAKAYELRGGVSDLENYYITFTYHRGIAQDQRRPTRISLPSGRTLTLMCLSFSKQKRSTPSCSERGIGGSSESTHLEGLGASRICASSAPPTNGRLNLSSSS
jgi:eukaryotic-like serine/threonine-protein kinase